MFGVIYPNRWLIWAVVISVVTAMLLYWAIALYSIELRWDPASDSISDALRNFKKVRLEHRGVSDWKTYQNEIFGYTIQYPVTFSFINEYDGGSTCFYSTAADSTISNGPKFCISMSNYIQFTPNKWLERIESLRPYMHWDPVRIGIYDGFVNARSSDASLSENFILFYRDFLVSISDTSQYGRAMLSTLKLPDVIETITWKTYQNVKYGFEFKYPKDWSFSGNDNVLRFSRSKPKLVDVMEADTTCTFATGFEGGDAYSEDYSLLLNGNSFNIQSVYTEGVDYPDLLVRRATIDNARSTKLDCPHLSFIVGSNGSFFLNEVLNSFKFIEPGN